MTPQEFAKAFYDEKEYLLDAYFERRHLPHMSKTDVGELISKLDLHDEQKDKLLKIVDGALRDALYRILIGLEGGTGIGSEMQQMFSLKDESGNQLTGGLLEEHAYEYFHGQHQ